jgi:hypothetical protein
VGCTGEGKRHHRDLEWAEGGAVGWHLGLHVLEHRALEIDGLRNRLGNDRDLGQDLLGRRQV